MPKSCALCNNKLIKGSKKTFHRFPENEDKKRIWCSAVHLRVENIKKNFRICSDHFLQSDIFPHSGRLQKDAVPRIFMELSHEESKNFKNEEENVLSATEILNPSKKQKIDPDYVGGSETDFLTSEEFLESEILGNPDDVNTGIETKFAETVIQSGSNKLSSTFTALDTEKEFKEPFKRKFVYKKIQQLSSARIRIRHQNTVIQKLRKKILRLQNRLQSVNSILLLLKDNVPSRVKSLLTKTILFKNQ